MDFTYRSRDGIPVRSTEVTSAYTRQLSLANSCAVAQGAISTRLSHITERVASPNSYTLTELIKVLESYLYILISTSFIQNLDASALSTHYVRYQKLISQSIEFPSEAYLNLLLSTDTLNWGTSYGTLGYELHLLESQETYQHPSQIAYLCTENQFKRFGFPDRLLNDLLSDDLISDRNIYQYSVESLAPYAKTMNTLRFLGTFSQDLFRWVKLDSSNSPFPPRPSQPELQLGYDYLIQITRVFLNYGFDDTLALDLDYQLIHQSLPPILPELWERLVFLRKAPLYLPNPEGGVIDQLVDAFLKGVPDSSKGEDLQVDQYRLLGNLPSPGGYNQLLVLLSTSLMNRAYILLYNYRQPNLVYQAFRPTEVNRALNLIYMAGYLLKKCNLLHWIILGSNLIALSERSDDTPVTIKTLLK